MIATINRRNLGISSTSTLYAEPAHAIKWPNQKEQFGHD